MQTRLVPTGENLSKRKIFASRRQRIAAESAESASQNSFLIPTSQKLENPRVSSGAEVKIFGAPVETGKG